MIEKSVNAFSDLSEFASISAGGKVLFSTDDFFAACENMVADNEPIFITDKYTEYGKWMDGWETRRKRIAGHDWCIIKLAAKCVIRGLLLDTAFFTGNYAPKFSIQAAILTPEEEALIPARQSKMGTACTDQDMQQIYKLQSDKWDEIVPVTALRPGYEDTRFNYHKVVSDESWTHIRLNIYPDGGIARLRVYGEVKPEKPRSDEIVDLLSLLTGAVCQGRHNDGYSNAHYGHPRNLIKPGKSQSMADGWETARRLDRPKVLEFDNDGTLKFSGNEWAVFKLGFAGKVKEFCIDTSHFKGNYPDSVKIEGVYLGSATWSPDIVYDWQTVLKRSKLSAHKEHWFYCGSNIITHVRITMAPDGGFSRIRAYGYVADEINTN